MQVDFTEDVETRQYEIAACRKLPQITNRLSVPQVYFRSLCENLPLKEHNSIQQRSRAYQMTVQNSQRGGHLICEAFPKYHL